MLFVRETSDSLTSLVKKIDQRMQAAHGRTKRALGSYVIFLNAAPGLDGQLRAIAAKEAVKRVALGIGVPPNDYQVDPEADMTVVVYSFGRPGGQKVTANFA